MTHQKIRIPKEIANETLRALGNLEDGVEFVDLTQDDIEAKKNFSQMLKRCDDIIKKINDFNSICEDFKLETEKFNSYKEYDNLYKIDLNDKKKLGSTYFDYLENEILEKDRELTELVDNHSTIREDLVTLIEKKYVLKKTSELITSNNQIINMSIQNNNNIEDDIISTTSSHSSELINPINVVDNLSFISGVIKLSDELKMKRMIFRVSRGRAIASFYNLVINNDEYLYTSSIRNRGFSFADKKKKKKLNNYDDNEKSSFINESDMLNNQKKVIFNILFQGGVENVLLGKILKICEMFQASRYNVPKREEIQNEISKIEDDIKEKKNLLVQTEKSINDLITKNNIINNRFIKYSLYKLYFLQEKMIYLTLNKCIVRENFIDGEFWIPERSLSNLLNNINSVSQGKDDKLRANVEEIIFEKNININPPTYIPTNEFLYAFQEIVNIYGIPRYREINPGFFNVITFPFLFGVMFGDIGHSLIIFFAALYFCINSKTLENNTLIKNLLPFRYFLLLMGFFGTFCGFMYNDFLSVPINFPTCFTNKVNQTLQLTNKENETKINFYELNKTSNCNYKFGLDPIWVTATNELTVINSLKMKLSVIFGVMQMLLGIILKGLNNILECDMIEFFFVFIPEFILMLILFGYMDLLIILKWNNNYMNDTGNAPDIKSIMMEIFLKPMGNYTRKPIWGDEKKMAKFHSLILIVSIICLIIMILPTVLLKNIREKKKNQNQKNSNKLDKLLINEHDFHEELIDNKKNENSEKNFSDILVAVLIETIEFALGTVSNTASYLRLWALSLAHSQLSDVFFNGTIGLFQTNYFIINAFLLSTFGIVSFVCVTFIVLLFMDAMESFLHTLRLHWVEFQNKFFHADGHMFMPFCFKNNLPLNDDNM